MPTDAEQIRTIKSQTLAVLADVTANPKPSYSIDGQAVSWGDYLAQLRETVRWCDEQLDKQEPFEEHTRGCT